MIAMRDSAMWWEGSLHFSADTIGGGTGCGGGNDASGSNNELIKTSPFNELLLLPSLPPPPPPSTTPFPS
ncbi:hypothetical protein M0804_013697 [Polistes exclamans]|nr:hypothetical protein M0804_013697 [Polistes exclamans]